VYESLEEDACSSQYLTSDTYSDIGKFWTSEKTVTVVTVTYFIHITYCCFPNFWEWNTGYE